MAGCHVYSGSQETFSYITASILELTALLRRPYNTRLIRCAHMASRPSVQQAVHDRDDEYGLSQARGGEINTYPRMCEKGAACACSAVDIWGSAWASDVYITSVGKGFIKMRVSTCRLYTALEPQSGASTGLLARGEPIEHHQIGPHTDYHRPVLHQSGTNP